MSSSAPQHAASITSRILPLAAALACGFAAAGQGLAPGVDLKVGNVSSATYWGQVSGIAAFSLGFSHCNGGAQTATFAASTPQHPIMVSSLHRLKDGRMEMIGMSWVLHGICALENGECGTCSSVGNCNLGPGCATPSTGTAAGTQAALGPRSQVNAATGAFPYPFTAPAAPATIGRRLQVALADVMPALNPGALYFVEVMDLSAQDAASGNAGNNATWRRVTFSPDGTQMSVTGPVSVSSPVLQAWHDHGLGLGAPDPGVQLSTVEVPGDGTLVVACRAAPLPRGGWSYEYAIQNVDSDRAVRGASIPRPLGAAISALGFHAPAYHSGEPYSAAPWTPVVDAAVVSWSCPPYSQDAQANAVRFGVVANVRFESDLPPAAREMTLQLFKPGVPESVTVPVMAPAWPADLDGNGTVDGADLGLLVGQWGAAGSADLDHDGVVGGGDLGILLGEWTG